MKAVMVSMARERLKTMTAKVVRLRGWVQAGFLLVWLIPLRMFSVCGPVFHCYACPWALFACPIGVMAQYSALHVFPLMALGTVLATGALVGAFVCGWMCPFGFLQDLTDRIPTPKLRLPAWTGHFRYVVLVALVGLVPFLWGEGHALFICRVCPAGALEGAVPGMVQAGLTGGTVVWPNVFKITVVGLVVVGMFFVYRPWCTVFCPLGAIYSGLNRGSLFFLQFHADRCTSCRLCHKQCKIGIQPEARANDPRCIRCLECTDCGAITVAGPTTSGVGGSGSSDTSTTKPFQG